MGSDMHDPLPYVVRLRVVEDDDKAPTVTEYKLTAYSAVEALTQAMAMALGAANDDKAKVKVEHIGADVDAYFRMLTDKSIAKVARASR